MSKIKLLILMFAALSIGLGIAGFVSFHSASDRCDCTPSEAYRTGAKHQANTASFHRHIGAINAGTMQSWEEKYAIITAGIGRNNESKALPRQKSCPEDSLYTFDDYVFRIRTGEADCDLHLECGPMDSNLEVGLEIPIENCALQNELIAKLKAKGFKISKGNKTGVHIKAEGFGFYDGWHNKWELHPVFSIEVLDN